MIKGKIKEALTQDAILQKISTYDVYVKFMPHRNWELNEVCISPFPRPGKGIEGSPSFIIGNKYGDITHFDFGMPEIKGDCFAFVKQLHNLSTYDDVLKVIDNAFGLGISSQKKDYKLEISQYKQPEITKRSTFIQVATRAFTKEELKYWNEYHQDISDLKENDIFSIKKLYVNKKSMYLPETQLRFGYFYNGHWKIYRPFENKKKKWMPNNVPITTMDGLNNIKNCDTAFINKSKKDMMVVKKVFSCSCAVQNEGIACFNDENIQYLKTNSNKQILGFDSDETGVRTSQQITKLFDFEYCNVPKPLLLKGIKDYAEWGKQMGIKAIEEHFKNKGI